MFKRSFRSISQAHYCKRWISSLTPSISQTTSELINQSSRRLSTQSPHFVDPAIDSSKSATGKTAVNQSIDSSDSPSIPSINQSINLSINSSIKQSINQSINQSTSPLVDSFGRNHTYLRISLTERCNLRCQYCMPEEGITLTQNDSLLTSDEIKLVMQKFVDHGVNKIRFTGGEPLVRKDIQSIIAAAGALREKGLHTVGMTTNGLVLSRSVDKLIDAGLTHINISLDTLHAEKFEQITRRRGHDRVLKAIDDCISRINQSTNQSINQSTNSPIGLQSVKVNCVIQRGVNDNELIDLVEWSLDRNIELRFIEYMPFDGNRWKNDQFMSYQEMKDIIETRFTLVRGSPNQSLNQSSGQSINQSINQSFHQNHEVSKVWHVPGHISRIGFISSMTDHFCSSCNRLRITADGQLKVCLFDGREVSLRDAIRSGLESEEIDRIIKMAVMKKKAAHAGRFNIAKSKNRPMITIGG